MGWVAICWSAGMGACLFLALTHFLNWYRDRASWACFSFTVLVLAVLGLGVCERLLMVETSPGAFSGIVRLGHLIFGVAVVASLCYVHFTFRSGRTVLFQLAIGLRVAAVAANYLTGSSLHFLEVRSLDRILFLGEEVSIVGEAVPNPWMLLGQLASVVQVAYVVDASWRLWRKGGVEARRQALWTGGAVVFFFLAVMAYAALIAWSVFRAPLLASFPFLGIALVIGVDISRKIQRSAGLSRELEQSEHRLSLAASAARLALWEWDVRRDRLWISTEGWNLLGVAPGGALDLAGMMDHVHPEDRSSLDAAVLGAVSGGADYEAEFRVVRPDGGILWMASTGRVERDAAGRAVLLRGVSMDVSRRQVAELEAVRQRRELAHLSRVGMLGELSGALAHELNQPLAAILSNAQTGRRQLTANSADTGDLDEILDDIVEDAKRAGGIVHGLRAMVRKEAVTAEEAVDLNGVVEKTLKLLHGEIAVRKVRVEFHPEASLPGVRGSFVEMQQIFINLILNSLDALRPVRPDAPTRGDRIEVATRCGAGEVLLEVGDNGPGIPREVQERLFEPFFSTKSGGYGLGLGLSISRSIAERSGGSLEAVDPPDGEGALFQLRLPVAAEPREAP